MVQENLSSSRAYFQMRAVSYWARKVGKMLDKKNNVAEIKVELEIIGSSHEQRSRVHPWLVIVCRSRQNISFLRFPRIVRQGTIPQSSSPNSTTNQFCDSILDYLKFSDAGFKPHPGWFPKDYCFIIEMFVRKMLGEIILNVKNWRGIVGGPDHRFI